MTILINRNGRTFTSQGWRASGYSVAKKHSAPDEELEAGGRWSPKSEKAQGLRPQPLRPLRRHAARRAPRRPALRKPDRGEHPVKHHDDGRIRRGPGGFIAPVHCGCGPSPTCKISCQLGEMWWQYIGHRIAEESLSGRRAYDFGTDVFSTREEVLEFEENLREEALAGDVRTASRAASMLPVGRLSVLGLDDVDQLNGYTFEVFVAELLTASGGRNVVVRGGANDGGVDITGTLEQLGRIIVQCKHSTKPDKNSVDASHIRELNGARADHDVDVALMVTNRKVTRQAWEAADRFRIHIVGRIRMERWAFLGWPMEYALTAPEASSPSGFSRQVRRFGLPGFEPERLMPKPPVQDDPEIETELPLALPPVGTPRRGRFWAHRRRPSESSPWYAEQLGDE
ncbi:restriction endonuclease [Streptomyces sp. NPDC058052]|uniref:restriction endonuclease n=1 Tax=Streptomyces sp. NPDC058052 TaxID=3346316 RepID=UPI0036EF9BB2